MALSANSGSERARQLLALTTRLGDRLARETEILEAHRPQDLAGEVEETQSLSNLYRYESARIRRDPSLLEGMTPVEKLALRKATELFQERLHRYELAVTAARVVPAGVIAADAQDLDAIRSRGMTYGAKGRTVDSGIQSLNYTRQA